MRSPANGVRLQWPQDGELGGSVPMLLRTSIEANSGMKNCFDGHSESPPS